MNKKWQMGHGRGGVAEIYGRARGRAVRTAR